MAETDPATPHAPSSTHGVAVFLALAFGVSWTIAAAGWWFGPLQSLTTGVTDPIAGLVLTGVLVAYMAGPGVAAFICAIVFDRGRRRHALGFTRPSLVWILMALVLPCAFLAASVGFTVALTEREARSLAIIGTLQRAAVEEAGGTLDMSDTQLALVQLAVAVPIGIALNTLVMVLTEEVGWRGWLWDRWARLGFWRNAGLTGLVWGVWHAPIIAMGHNYPQYGAGPQWWIGVIWMIGFILALSPMIHLVRERGGSMLTAAVFHAALNGLAALSIVTLSDASMPWRGALGVGGLLAGLASVVFVVAYRAARPLREA